MENKDFSIGITLKMDADDVLQKVSNVPEWWGISFTGSAKERGDTFTVKMGGDSFFNFTVTEKEPGKRIVWHVDDCNMPWYADKKEWANTSLIFELEEQDGVTKLRFTHMGLTPAAECYKDCEPGWTHWIATSLLSYLTTGTGVFREPTR